MKKSELEDSRIHRSVSLITPRKLKAEIPLSAELVSAILDRRKCFNATLTQNDGRFIIQAGPCSIHNVEATLVYAKKLAQLAKAVSDKILIVMRVYPEKPRTTVGWEGMLSDPQMNGQGGFNKGVRIVRRLMRNITKLGLPIVTEILGAHVPEYLADMLTSATLGARTVESQPHRKMASGLSCAVGCKNSIAPSCAVKNALDAMIAARAAGVFYAINQNGHMTEFHTHGNPDGYLILRGTSDGPNYSPAHIARVVEEIQLRKIGFFCPIVVDCSHGNSNKKHELQATAFRSVITQRLAGNTNIVGVMLESFLEEGCQSTSAKPLNPAQSVTDSCIGWEETEQLIMWAYRVLP